MIACAFPQAGHLFAGGSAVDDGVDVGAECDGVKHVLHHVVHDEVEVVLGPVHFRYVCPEIGDLVVRGNYLEVG